MKKGKLVHSERRRYVRLQPKEAISIHFKVITQAEEEKAPLNRLAKIKNASKGGMFLEIPPLKPKLLEGLLRGTHELFLEIDIPSVSHPIKALAKVVWIEGKSRYGYEYGYGVGVSFLSINEEDRDNLISYIIKRDLRE